MGLTTGVPGKERAAGGGEAGGGINLHFLIQEKSEAFSLQ
jgi:hypothetical protein